MRKLFDIVKDKINKKKNKNSRGIVFVIFLIFTSTLFLQVLFSFPLKLVSQPYDDTLQENSIDQKSLQDNQSFSSKEITIKEVDTAGFPNVYIYFNFKEGSKLSSLDLNESDFKIIENNKEVSNFKIQKVGEISEPIGVVLVIDTSGSMRGKPIDDAIDAAVTFINEMRNIDKIAIIGFADEVYIYSNFTSNKEQLKSSLSKIYAGGETSLFDGIQKGLQLFDKIDYLKHKYLIVLSDGADTISKSTVNDIILNAKTAEVSIYSIALMSNEFNLDNIKNISESSGGQLLQANNSEDLKNFYRNISEKIRNQYKLSFTSLFPYENKFMLQLFIEKSGIKDSINLYYENPFKTAGSATVLSNTQNTQLIANIMIIDIWWIKLIIYLLIFISVTLFIYICSIIMVPGGESSRNKNILDLYNISDKGLLLKYKEEKRKSVFSEKFLNFISKLFARRGFADLFEQKLRRAGMSISGSKFVALHIIAVIVITLLVFILTKNFLITLMGVLFVIFAPFLVINFKTSQRIKKFNEQLPDTLQLIEGALKAGYSLNQSLGMVINETKPPISDEFRITINEIRMGLPEKNALENMAKRINSELFDWVVLAVNIQRDVGGNLAEIMDIIANTIREKDRILRQIKALTAEGKLSAYVLIGLPIILGAVLSFLNKEYISVLFTTRIGLLMLFVAAILMIVGIIWIIKIIKIEY